MRANVIYEENLQISTEKVFDITMKWLNSQYKAKIKESTPPSLLMRSKGR